jgi:hypothetical protein
MRRLMISGFLALGVAGCGGGKVVGIKFVHQDKSPYDGNTSAYFTCAPNDNDPSYTCRSAQSFHQYDHEVQAGSECSYGIATVYVETTSSGNVARVQYQCAVAPVDTGLPSDTAPPQALPAAASAPVAPGRP